MKQFILTVSAGKRLIGRGMAAHPAVAEALPERTIVIVAGTTNAYVAEEILSVLGQAEDFRREGFRRGFTVPPGVKVAVGQLPGDVVIAGGQWQRGRQVFDVIEDLRQGDIIIKGANALDLARRRSAVLVGHPQSGTIGAILPVSVGRRVRLIVPVGLEKRVTEDLDVLAGRLNAAGAEGPRLMPIPGEVFTELDAIERLTGAKAFLAAAGGVLGAEGACWVGVDGSHEQLQAAEELIRSVEAEPATKP